MITARPGIRPRVLLRVRVVAREWREREPVGSEPPEPAWALRVLIEDPVGRVVSGPAELTLLVDHAMFDAVRVGDTLPVERMVRDE